MKNLLLIFTLMICTSSAFALPSQINIKDFNFVDFLLSPIRLDGMSVSKGEMYALERVQKRLIVLDPETGKINREKSFSEGYEPHSIFVDDDFIYLGVVSMT